MNDYTKLTKDQINEMPVKYEGKIQVLKSKDDIKDSIDYQYSKGYWF